MRSSSRNLLVLVCLVACWCSYRLYSSTISGEVAEDSKSINISPFSDESTAMAASLQFLAVAARAKHTATVIFIHGLGDTGHGWESVATMFGSMSDFKHIKWVLPHAPEMAVTANLGSIMPSWFDIEGFDFATEDEKGMLDTVGKLNQLITAEVDAGIPAERIVVGGFSQGGAMSLLTGLTAKRRLGGVAVMSGWLPLKDKFKTMMSEHAKTMPIFWGHGVNDPLVRYIWAQKSVEFLEKELGIGRASGASLAGVEFHGYRGLVHSASEEELDHLQAWMKKVVPA